MGNSNFFIKFYNCLINTFSSEFLINVPLFLVLIFCLVLILVVLFSVAYFTVFERKLLASLQARKGPTKVGVWGLLQPISDGVKLILKETIVPRNSFPFVFFIAPIIGFVFGFAAWSLIPFDYGIVLCDFNYGVLFIFVISIFHVYSLILAGWASNSKYAFLGALRSAAQLIAYDIPLGLSIMIIYMFVKTLNLTKIVEFQMNTGWLICFFPSIFIIYFICIVAETNRHPFDLPEAESELVSGYNVEYSATGFALFFLGEYASIMFVSMYSVTLFLGGWDVLYDSPHSFDYIITYVIIKFLLIILKLGIFISAFIYLRASLPRYKYNQLMSIGWRYLVPFALSYFLLVLVLFRLAQI